MRAKGLWRSREASGAVCEPEAVENLIRALTQAHGIELTRDPARAGRYGFGPDERLGLALHGPKFLERDDRDTLAALELGRSFDSGPSGRACARQRGSDSILELDRDPRRLLASTVSGVPPLVDTRLLAGCFGPGFVGFRAMTFAYADGRTFALSTVPPPSADAQPEWTLERGSAREPAIVWRVGGYTSLWIRGRARDYENPKQAAQHGLDAPWLRIVLTPSQGEPIELRLSELSPGNEAWLWNRRTNVLMRIEADLWRDLGAEPVDFIDTAHANRWERWLTR